MKLANEVSRLLSEESAQWEVTFKAGVVNGVKLDGKPILVSARSSREAITKAGKKVGLDLKESLAAPTKQVKKL